ncbi:4-hydroxybenzoate polyprenyltransferase, putative [Pyrobaculum islandicum DSM 4184]|uniref:4-hydroxybenzoate polyprenyltransferase, putative n=1 Tax=Pyrobaculum islandicum (strain DSM 4184 / JCM 9189 / GEO3) TaxID=384616 RepID=A1RS55_PYRIL|nr:UbiA-like polyprenyltransferase [Pyrobaculum islandicum]ABL87787.1 4-hydroxybenzoate polyprenyltransferase, putative [Pyrobaculum islandicum DSM 4184]
MLFDPEVVGTTTIRILRFIRVEHTIFTLPMAYAAALLTGGVIDFWKAVFIGLAVFGLRTAGMAWNNIADYPIDKLNPRTQRRMLVSGKISFREAYGVFLFGVAIFILSAMALGKWPLTLSLPYLAVVMTYPYAKRVHCIPHLHLGLVYALVPLGAAIATYPDDIQIALAKTPWILVVASALWVAGFDVMYSKGDYEFDKRQRLGSIPACFGLKAADIVTALLMSASATLYIVNYISYGLNIWGLVLTSIGAFLEIYSAVLGIRGDVARGFNLNLAVGIFIPFGIFVGYY